MAGRCPALKLHPPSGQLVRCTRDVGHGEWHRHGMAPLLMWWPDTPERCPSWSTFSTAGGLTVVWCAGQPGHDADHIGWQDSHAVRWKDNPR